MKIEDAKWTPPRGVGLSESVKALRNLKVGECKRIIHDDLACNLKSCSLRSEVGVLTKKGWTLESYHEKAHFMVIRRLD